VINVEIKNLPAFDKDSLKSISSELSTLISERAETLFRESIENVGAVATGDLLRSVTSEVLGESSGSLLLSVGSSNDAVNAIENGLPPGTNVNIDKLRVWMVARGLDAGNTQLVNSIANKIYTQGFEAKEPFAKAFNSSQFNDIMNTALDEVLNNAEWTK
jgi:hypothetical protein